MALRVGEGDRSREREIWLCEVCPDGALPGAAGRWKVAWRRLRGLFLAILSFFQSSQRASSRGTTLTQRVEHRLLVERERSRRLLNPSADQGGGHLAILPAFSPANPR